MISGARPPDAMRKKGLTLPELAIASVVTLFVAAGAVSVYMMTYSGWRESIALANLQRSSNIAVNSIARGVREDGGFTEAASFSVPASSDVRFTSGIDSFERRFYLDAANGQLIYKAPSGNEEVITKNVSSLTFTQVNTRRLRVKLSLREQVINKTVDVTLETDITRRNE